MKPRSASRANAIFALLLSGAVMFASGLMLSGFLRKPPIPDSPPVRRIVEIPVAESDIPAGTPVSEIRFVNISLPESEIPIGALRSLSGLASKRAASTLAAGVPLLETSFSEDNRPENPVVDSIPPGMRAMTIKVDATSAVEGWAGSGSIVDVLLVEKDRTSVIAEKVKVLSAERSVSPVDGRSSPSVPSTVTLLTTQEQCLAINTAIPLGRIAFALRSAKDEDRWLNTSFSRERFRGVSAQERPLEQVTGYAALKGANSKVYALSGGRWTKTDVFPEGFAETTSQ